MLKPVLAGALLLAAAGAWYWALLPVSMPRAAPVRESREAVTAGVPRVHLDRLASQAAVAPVSAGRDPFRNGRHAADVPARARPAAVAVAPPAVSPPPSAWPRLELIGVAEGRDGAALVRTAILSGPRGVHHVRAGDTVEQVYRLDRIAADGVELRLLPEDRSIRLALRP